MYPQPSRSFLAHHLIKQFLSPALDEDGHLCVFVIVFIDLHDLELPSFTRTQDRLCIASHYRHKKRHVQESGQEDMRSPEPPEGPEAQKKDSQDT